METKEQYYKRIEPADAHVLEKFLKPEAEHSKISNGVGEVSEEGVEEVKEVEVGGGGGGGGEGGEGGGRGIGILQEEVEEAKFVESFNLCLLQVGQREN